MSEYNIKDAPDNTLICNRNCHSCAVLAHGYLIQSYNVRVKDVVEKDGDFPVLKYQGQIYRGVELQRKLFENKGIMTVSDEDLQKIVDGNEHRNCTCEKSDNYNDDSDDSNDELVCNIM